MGEAAPSVPTMAGSPVWGVLPSLLQHCRSTDTSCCSAEPHCEKQGQEVECNVERSRDRAAAGQTHGRFPDGEIHQLQGYCRLRENFPIGFAPRISQCHSYL